MASCLSQDILQGVKGINGRGLYKRALESVAAAKDMYRFEDVENALGAMKAEARVTTAFGLVVAIPTTLAGNYFMRQLQLIESTLNNLTYTLSRLIAQSLCL
jgi:hypothetical protein